VRFSVVARILFLAAILNCPRNFGQKVGNYHLTTEKNLLSGNIASNLAHIKVHSNYTRYQIIISLSFSTSNILVHG
jgi:hypothetical protein